MKRIAAFAAVVALAASATAAPLPYSLNLVASQQTTNAFVYDGEFDVYNVEVSNPNDAPATSLELTLPLTDAINTVDNNNFSNSADLPVVFGFTAPDTFFVIPSDQLVADVLAVEVEDSDSILSAGFTVAGGAELVPAQGSAIVATIAVPTGVAVDLPVVIGEAAVGGMLEIVGVPEPTTALLAGLSLVGFGFARRR